MEKNYRKYPDKWDSSLDVENPKGTSVAERVTLWMKNKPVGTTLSNLKEVFHRELHKDILFVRFEDLCRVPKQTMELIHEFLDADQVAIHLALIGCLNIQKSDLLGCCAQ
jgi:hypothetical protein